MGRRIASYSVYLTVSESETLIDNNLKNKWYNYWKLYKSILKACVAKYAKKTNDIGRTSVPEIGKACTVQDFYQHNRKLGELQYVFRFMTDPSFIPTYHRGVNLRARSIEPALYEIHIGLFFIFNNIKILTIIFNQKYLYLLLQKTLEFYVQKNPIVPKSTVWIIVR